MELEMGFREVLVEGDRTLLYYVARALHYFQTLFGTIPNIHAKGTSATVRNSPHTLSNATHSDDLQSPTLDPYS